MPNFIDYSNPITDEPESDAERLLRAMREHRRDYMNGRLDSLNWIRARRMIIREAEHLGITDEIISKLNRS
jgi:hypothetical protein